MGDFSITYDGPLGRQREEFSNIATLNLSMRTAINIDLEPLRSNAKLTSIELSKNQLESIDLEPLCSCSNLRQIRIRSNRLTTINLWPLLDLEFLEEVDLVNNRLQSVDITPVIKKSNVLLDEGVQVRVDYVLRYLVGGEDSSRIQLYKSVGDVVDSSPRLHWQHYADLTEEYGWEDVCYNTLAVIEQLDERSWFRAQKGFLEGMGMPELSGYDGNPSLLLKDLEETSDFHSVRSSVFDVATNLLESQLQSGGPTIFLNVDKIAGTRALRLIPLITKLRDKEMETAIVQIGGNQVNLLPLWFTHWGYEILSVLRFGLTTDLDGFDLIQRNFEKIGYQIKSEEVNHYEIEKPENMSEGMVDYIYTIATMNYTNTWIRR